jgi:hypothetical protein
VDDDARRLVDRDQVLVFVQDVERKVLGRHRGPGRSGIGRQGDRQDVASRHAGRGAADRPAVDRHAACSDPGLHARARRLRQARKMTANHEIEPPAVIAAVGHNTPLLVQAIHVMPMLRSTLRSDPL